MGPCGGFGATGFGGNGIGSGYSHTPVFGLSAPSITPHPQQAQPQQPNSKTPAEIGEVVDEAMLEIISDTDRGAVLQDVVDGLSRPRDPQLVKVNNLLVKKDKAVDERLDGLVKYETNRQANKKK